MRKPMGVGLVSPTEGKKLEREAQMRGFLPTSASLNDICRSLRSRGERSLDCARCRSRSERSLDALDEVVLTVQARIRDFQVSEGGPRVPFCAFNGGQDAWLDVGNKYIGLRTLQAYLGISPRQCLHIGDQFTVTGNDISTRDACPTIWVTDPSETGRVVKYISRSLRGMELDLVSF